MQFVEWASVISHQQVGKKRGLEGKWLTIIMISHRQVGKGEGLGDDDDDSNVLLWVAIVLQRIRPLYSSCLLRSFGLFLRLDEAKLLQHAPDNGDAPQDLRGAGA